MSASNRRMSSSLANRGCQSITIALCLGFESCSFGYKRALLDFAAVEDHLSGLRWPSELAVRQPIPATYSQLRHQSADRDEPLLKLQLVESEVPRFFLARRHWAGGLPPNVRE